MHTSSSSSVRRVVILSLLLFVMTVPHVLEDFATGEPAQAGIPAPLLSLVVAAVIALQALGLYWLGQGRPRGLYVHLVVGLFWPITSGVAQLPTILDGTPYRAGFISVLYVAGIIVIGVLLLVSTLQALRSGRDARRLEG